MRVLGRIDQAGVVPIFEVLDEGWRRIDPAEFPKVGQVFWHNPKDAHPNALLFFTPERNSGGDRRGWNHTFRVAEPKAASEIVDLRSFGSIEGVRRAIVSRKVPRGVASGNVLLRCEGYLVGPVRVKGEALLEVGSPQLDEVPYYPDAEIKVREVEDDRGHLRLMLMGDLPAAPTGLVDWDPDEAVVRRALQALAEQSFEDKDGVALTNEIVARLARLASITGSSLESSLKRSQLERARDLLADSKQLEVNAKLFAASLTAHHPVIAKQLLTAAARASLEPKLRAEFEAKVRAELGEEQKRIDDAKRELASVKQQITAAAAERDAKLRAQLGEDQKRIDDAKRELASVKQQITAAAAERDAKLRAQLGEDQKRIDDAKRELASVKQQFTTAAAEHEAKLRAQMGEDQKRIDDTKRELASLKEQAMEVAAELERRRATIREVEASAGQRVRELLERPDALLAEVALIRAVVPPLVGPAVPANGAKSPGAAPPQASKRTSFAWPHAKRKLVDVPKLRQALTVAFKSRGIAPASAIKIHAAFVAGLLPVVAGPGALAALEAYADAACAGRRVLVHTSPAMLEPSDLFGRLDGDRFVPHAAGLLDAVRVARENGDFGLAIVEGVNRAPTEAFLAPLLDVVDSGSDLRLFHPEAVTAEGVAPSMKWPSNLRLAATVVEGPTSLPISRDIWARAVVIEVALGETTPAATDPSEVEASSDLLKPASSQRDLVEALLELPEAAHVRHALERFSAALGRFESNAAALRSHLVEHILVPVAATLTSENERDAALQGVLAAQDDAQKTRLTALAMRLRRRIA